MKYSNSSSDSMQDKLFICSYPNCGKKFKTKFSMCRHNLVHSQEKNFSCKYCGKKFALYQYLKEHTNTHTSEKPYVCGVSGCKERFSQTGKLSLHRRTHPEYKLKKYHPNSEYNKQKNSESHSSSSIQSPQVKKPRKKVPEQKVITRREEPTKKQKNSKESNNPPSMSFGHNLDTNALQTSATKESVDANLMVAMNLDDPYIRYLAYLPYSTISTIRPVLPLPRKMGGKNVELKHYIPLNLFELVVKCAN